MIMNERTTLAIRLLATHILLQPVLIVISAFMKGDLFLTAFITQILLIITFLSGYWEFPGRFFKIIFHLIMEGLLLTGVASKYSTGNWQKTSLFVVILLGTIALYELYHLVKILIVIYRKDHDAFEIEFPFRNGRYLVTDGGNSRTSRLMNYHFFSPVHMKKNTNRSMLYATDVVKLPMGINHFMPRRNEDYPVFGDNLYSPVSGKIFKVTNDIEDNIPYSGNYPYNTGNTVVIRKDDFYFLLGHMKKNSITVKEGDEVKAGDLVGEAGNSGMSERPHLHMQLMQSMDENYWKGTGINIIFRGRNLFKNRVVKV